MTAGVIRYSVFGIRYSVFGVRCSVNGNQTKNQLPAYVRGELIIVQIIALQEESLPAENLPRRLTIPSAASGRLRRWRQKKRSLAYQADAASPFLDWSHYNEQAR